MPAGDVDGDGYPDIAVGSAGYINATGGSVRVASGATGQELYRAHEDPMAYSTGLSLANMGDLDGDGIDDLAAGDELWGDASSRPGSVTLTLGGTGALIELLSGERTLDLFGWSVSRVPDVDLDGVAELAVGAPGFDGAQPSAGALYLYSGSSRALLWRVEGTEVGEALGYVVRGLGDIDGDGRGDLFVSAPGATSSSGLPSAGRVMLLSGLSGAVLRTMDGTAADESMGRALEVVGDMDGDGHEDVIVGAPFASGAGTTRAGRVDVLSSATGMVLWSESGSGLGETLGQNVADAGDIDGDGARDFAYTRRPQGAFDNETEVIVRSNVAGRLLFRVPSTNFLSDRHPISGVGDLSGDGVDDLLVGSPITATVLVYQLGNRPQGSICRAEPNSASLSGAELSAQSGSQFLSSVSDVRLVVYGLPPQSTGYFLVSTTLGTVTGAGGSEGTLCIGGPPFGRYADQVLTATNPGFFNFSVFMDIRNDAIPLANGPVSGTVAAGPAETFYFQYWYRDVTSGGAPTSNLSNAIAITYR